MGYGFITRRGGGYAEGDAIPVANLQPVYQEDLKYTDRDVVVYNITSGEIIANPIKDIIYNITSNSTSTKIDIYSSSGNIVSSISPEVAYGKAWNICKKLNFDNDGNLYLSGSGKVIKISPNGEVSDFINYDTTNTNLFAWNNNTLYRFSKNSFTRYNQSGVEISTLAVDNMTYLQCVSFDDDNNCYVYASYKDGVQKYTGGLTKISAIDFGYPSSYDTFYIRNMFNAGAYLYMFGYYTNDNSNDQYILLKTTMASSSDKTLVRTYDEQYGILRIPTTVEILKKESNTYIFADDKGYRSGYTGFGLYDISYNPIYDNLCNYPIVQSCDMNKSGDLFSLESSYSSSGNFIYSVYKYHPAVIKYNVLSES